MDRLTALLAAVWVATGVLGRRMRRALRRALPLVLAGTWLALSTSTPAHAVPAAAVVAFFATVGVTVGPTIAAVVAFVVNVAISIGVNALTTKLFGPKLASDAQARQASVLSLTLGEAPRQAIFGRAATGGVLKDAFNFGGSNGTDWEVRVVKVADHKCDALEGFILNDTLVPFVSDGAVTGFNGQLEVYWKNGDPAQTASSYLVTNSASRIAGTPWTTNDVCASEAYVIFAYKADAPNATSPVWPQGRPSFIPVVRGKLCYDPRKDSTVAGGSGSHRWTTPSTWEWSENAAICDYNYDLGVYALDAVTDPKSLLVGRGLSLTQAPPSRVAARANVCDEAVSLKAGGTEPRYRVGGVVFANETFDSIKQKFADAMGGDIIKRLGGVEVLPGAAQSVVAELTDASFVVGKSISYEPFLSDNDRVNVVTPHFNDPAQLYKTTAAPIRRSTADITADGGQKVADVPLDLVTSGTQAQRVGEIKRRLARKEKRLAGVLSPIYADLEDGDWVGYTSDRYFSGARIVFRINAYAVAEGYENHVVLAEIGSDAFGWTAASDEGPPGQAPVDEFGSLGPLALSGVVFSNFNIVGTDGTSVPGVKAVWTTPVDTGIRGVVMEVRKVGTTDAGTNTSNSPNDGKIIGQNGVTGGGGLEARLVPVPFDPQRKVTATAWTSVTTSPFSLPDLVAALSDGVLTKAEKRTFIPQVNALISNRTELRNRANALGLTTGTSTARANYETAATNLDSYLSTLTSPVAWNNSSDVTTIAVPATFKTRLEDATKYETDLQSAIDAASKGLIDNALSDGVLTISEKREVIPQINALIAARTLLRARANAVGLTTGVSVERAAYETAATNLDSYLAGLTSPVAWNNVSDVTTISSPSTYRTRREDADKTTTDLQSAVDAIYAGKTQYTDTNGMVRDYRGLQYGYTTATTAGRDSQPLTVSVGQIAVSSHNIIFPGLAGNTTIAIPAHTFTGLSNDQDYVIFYRPAFNDWFAVQAAFSPAFFPSPDGYLWIGNARTPTGGGTWTQPSTDFGTTGIYDVFGCVAASAYLPSGKRVADAVAGEPLTLMTPDGESLQPGRIGRIDFVDARLVRLETALGAVLTVSVSAPLMTRKGPGYLPRSIRAELAKPGLALPVLVDGKVRWDTLVSAFPVGVAQVGKISADSGIYAAADTAEGPFILTHNGYSKP